MQLEGVPSEVCYEQRAVLVVVVGGMFQQSLCLQGRGANKQELIARIWEGDYKAEDLLFITQEMSFGLGRNGRRKIKNSQMDEEDEKMVEGEMELPVDRGGGEEECLEWHLTGWRIQHYHHDTPPWNYSSIHHVTHSLQWVLTWGGGVTYIYKNKYLQEELANFLQLFFISSAKGQSKWSHTRQPNLCIWKKIQLHLQEARQLNYISESWTWLFLMTLWCFLGISNCQYAARQIDESPRELTAWWIWGWWIQAGNCSLKKWHQRPHLWP